MVLTGEGISQVLLALLFSDEDASFSLVLFYFFILF